MKKYHLVATIDVLRHGEKNTDGELRERFLRFSLESH